MPYKLVKERSMKPQFYPTDHFLYRQWERGIDNYLLAKVLPSIPDKLEKMQSVVVFPTFWKQKGTTDIIRQCLILIIKDGHCLVTCYWRDVNECFFNNSTIINPQIIF